MRLHGIEYISVRYMGKVYVAARHYGKVVFEAISSCFGSGVWRNDKPWSNKEAWRN